MIQVLRVLTQQSIEAMEGGRFQDFCLALLPIYDARFEGLSPLGQTAAGKTRAGTPDLLKTDASGAQTGVQCGTDETYWPSEDSIETSKPYSDALKCIAALDRPVEIVLVANREISPRSPNVKSRLIAALAQHTPARITPLALEDLSQFLVTRLDDRRVMQLFQEFCPVVILSREITEAARGFQIASAIVQVRPVDATSLLRLIQEALAVSPEVDQARDYVLQRLEELSRCRLPRPTGFSGVQRETVERLPLRAPLGKIWLLVGVPKIGKTSLLRQLSAEWTALDLHWFESSIDTTDECADEIATDILHLLLPGEGAEPLLRLPSRLREALDRAHKPERPVVVVIDNVDQLPDSGLRKLQQTLSIVRAHNAFSHIGCIFATTKRLPLLEPAVDQLVSAPSWTASELGRLLASTGIEFDSTHPTQFLEVLAARSGGHPLLAETLARRYSRLHELTMASLVSPPGLADEALSREVQHVLYEGILTDADAQNLVQRLAILIDRAPPDVVEALRTEVAPPISTASAVLLHRLGGSVIEGDPTAGYNVAFVFAQIAKTRISSAEQQVVYHVAAAHLLQPQGQVIDTDRVCSGILCAVLAHDTDEAVFWTTVLLYKALTRHVTRSQLEALLARLLMMSHLRPPASSLGRFRHAVMLTFFATTYSRVGRHELAAEVLTRIAVGDELAIESEEIRRELPRLRLFVACDRAINLLLARADGALEALTSLGESELAAVPPAQWESILDCIRHALLAGRLTEGGQTLIRGAFSQVEPSNVSIPPSVIRLASNVGSVAVRDDVDESIVNHCFPETPLGRLARAVAHGVRRLERREIEGARSELNQAIEMARALGLSDGAWAELQLHIGDVAYVAGNDTQAADAYAESIRDAAPDSFTSAWSSWHLGLLRDDPDALDRAATLFESHGLVEQWARAMGARGIVLLREQRVRDGLRCLADVLGRYARTKDSRIAAATLLIVAHLIRYQAQAEGAPIPEDNPSFPPLRPRLYEDIPSTAQPRWGPATALFIVARAFRHLGDSGLAEQYLHEAADSVPGDEVSQPLVPLILSGLLGTLTLTPRDPGEVARRFRDFLRSRRPAGSNGLFALEIFSQMDANLGRPGSLDRVESALNELERGMLETQTDETFWIAEILLRRAHVAQRRGDDPRRIVALYRQSLQKAIESRNLSVMVSSAHTLGFELVEWATSMRGTAQEQFELLRGTELGGGTFDSLGHNLYEVWSGFDYRRLSERDLEAKRMLMDSAKGMRDAQVPSNIGGPIMVLLLARLFQHVGPAEEWALGKVQANLPLLPEEVRQRLERA